jgi:hypothetical protein
VRISDGEILISENLKNTTGNIISMIKTSRPNEIAFTTKQGVFFANIGRGTLGGLTSLDVAKLELSERLHGRDVFA